MIARGDKRVTPYYEGAKPLEVRVGDVRIAGWQWQEQSGLNMPFEATYEDWVDVEALGKGKQAVDVWGTNLVSNGDFSNGTTGWTQGGTTLTVTDGLGTSLPSARYGGPSYYVSNGSTATAKYAGHKVYGAARIKVDNVTVANGVYIQINDGVNGLNLAATSAGVFSRVSGIRTVADTPSTLFIKMQDARTAEWTTSYIDDVIMLDLTDIFGVGKEPTAAQVDTMLSQYTNSWFNGSSMLTTDTVTYAANHPSPTYPSPIISSAGELRIEGRNLFGGWIHGEGISSTDGSIVVSASRSRTGYIPCLGNAAYTLHSLPTGYAAFVAFYDAGHIYLSSTGAASAASRTVTTPSTCRYMAVCYYAGMVGDIGVQLELGGVAHAYTPYRPIITHQLPELRGIPATYNPDGSVATWTAQDSWTPNVIVGGLRKKRTVQRIGALVFNGSENWTDSPLAPSGYIYLSVSTKAYGITNLLCSHFHVQLAFGTRNSNICQGRVNNTAFVVYPSFVASGTEWKGWLAAQYAAGTPVTVVYELATPIITDLGPIDLPSYYPHTRVMVQGDYPPDVTARCRVVDHDI